MLTMPDIPPLFMWLGFIGLIIIFLSIDLGLFNRKKHAISLKEALIWSGVWFTLAMLFNVFVWMTKGHDLGLQFFTGYLIEMSLSVDNLFVILLIFTSFQIAQEYRHKILVWGILGALVMRGALIAVGVALITRIHWILYVFGAFLIYAGIQMFFKKEGSWDPHDSVVVRWTKRVVHVVRGHHDGKFFVRENGKRAVTIAFVTLLVIEFTDLVFAFDSIPAIFAISQDPFIVFTSNIFAILGLRSLFFVIAKAHEYFAYLNIGLAVILIFVGLKMLLEHWVHINIFVSLGVVVAILAISVLSSVMFHKKHKLGAVEKK